jgi:glucosamine--fructose-6-phosphate aminotransferase (isomerizing)
MENHESEVTLSEIYNQPRACEETLARAEARLRILVELAPLEQYTDILLTGCGSSYNLAKCGSFAWSAILRRPVRAIASSELMGFPEVYLAAGARPLVVAISRTGGTTEVQLAVERMRSEYDARAMAITGQPHSAVGAVCDAEIAFTECHEESIVMTQAFTCMLTGLCLLADGAAGWRHRSNLSLIPRLISSSIDHNAETLRRIAEHQDTREFFYLGSGAMKGLSDECSLKMTEMALSPTMAHHSLEFRHGPKAALDEQSQVIIFPVAAERPHLDTLLGEIQATQAQTLVVSSEGNGDSNGFKNLQLGAELPEFLRPSLYAHIGQLLACWRSLSKGLNPHSPRHLARTVLLDV